MAHVTFCINLLALQFWDSKVQIIILLFMKKKKTNTSNRVPIWDSKVGLGCHNKQL